MPLVNHRVANRLLWTAQILVALVFAFAGSMKFIMSAAQMQQGPMVFPMWFLHFIGACECLGALGLILPAVTRIRTGLVPLAAAGLTIIMIGATTVTVISMGVLPALVPAAVGLTTTWIAYGRARIAPLAGASRRVLRAA